MDERTFCLTLPTGVADAFVAEMEQLLKEQGFQEQVRAGEVAGVEARVWRRGESQVVITVQEADAEETVTVAVLGIDGAALLGAAMAALLVELLERLPAETLSPFEPLLASLKQVADRSV